MKASQIAAIAAIGATLPFLQACGSSAALRQPAELSADITERSLDRSKLGAGQGGVAETETRQMCRTDEPGFVASLFGARAREICSDKLVIVRSRVVTNSLDATNPSAIVTGTIPQNLDQPLRLQP